MEYNQYGDIVLGDCDEQMLSDIIEYIKQKCIDGIQIYLKITNENKYYLSVPICIGSLLDNYDPYIYPHPSISQYYYYFIDVDCPLQLNCLTYSVEKQSFLSTDDREGCIKDDTIQLCESVYEISSEHDQEYKIT